MTNATKAAQAEAIARDAIAAAEQAGYRVEIQQQQGNCWDVRLYSTAAGYVRRGYNRRRDLAKADIGDAITKMLAEVTGQETDLQPYADGAELVADIQRQQGILRTYRLMSQARGHQVPQSGDDGFEEWACQALREQGETYRIIRGVKVPLGAPDGKQVHTVADLTREHIGWEIRVAGRSLSLSDLRTWTYDGRTMVGLVDVSGDLAPGIAGVERHYTPDTACRLIGRAKPRRRTRTP